MVASLGGLAVNVNLYKGLSYMKSEFDKWAKVIKDAGLMAN